VMQLDLAGAKLMGMATKKSIGKKLAFILNDKLLNVVGVMAMVDNGMTVMDRGTYTKEELEKFKAAVYQGMPLR
jgi:preprotein translocase subunit SecD